MDLERFIRDNLESMPVPEALTSRVRATVLRHRIVRYGALAAASAFLIVAAVFSLQPEPPHPTTPEPKIAFDVSLAEPALEAMWLQEIRFTAELDADYWYVMPGFLLSKVSPVPVDFFLRYSEADFDDDSIDGVTSRGFLTSGAWDKSQWTALAKWHLHPRAKVYFEYYWNDVDEPSGATVRSNDYAFIELILLY